MTSTTGRTPRTRRRASFSIGDLTVQSGRRGLGELPLPRLVTGTKISAPVSVVHGRTDGPTVWLSAAVHGDEICGVEIIRRALASIEPATLSGTIVAVPIVNVHGFLNGDRYLPDRRDLNRSFPGSANGSLAARIAHLFLTEVVARCDVGIDLHTGSDHRTNLPQIRANLDDPTTRDLAIAFGAPVMLHAKLRDGSLRAAATASDSTVLLFEGGEALRFDREAIRVGVTGIRRVLSRLGMIDGDETGPDATSGSNGAAPVPLECRSSAWIRSRRSGIASLSVDLGDHVEKGQSIAVVRDSVGRRLAEPRTNRTGIVIGHTQHPLVNQGDALVHVGELVDPIDVEIPADAATAETPPDSPPGERSKETPDP